jgi:hypothetical protein
MSSRFIKNKVQKETNAVLGATYRFTSNKTTKPKKQEQEEVQEDIARCLQLLDSHLILFCCGFWYHHHPISYS